jgi:hypothetical protein
MSEYTGRQQYEPSEESGEELPPKQEEKSPTQIESNEVLAELDNPDDKPGQTPIIDSTPES